jgi:hypothetical protein
LTLFLSKTGVISDRLRTKDVESNLRALIRMRTLRQHMERLRLLLDLARKREKLRKARLLLISDAIEAVLPPLQTSSSSSTVESLATISLSGSDFFDYSTSAAATATPNQGRVVRTPQLQSEISAAVTARALSYPRRRDQSHRSPGSAGSRSWPRPSRVGPPLRFRARCALPRRRWASLARRRVPLVARTFRRRGAVRRRQ